tara:strand:- start:9382 stop:9735 length:354 start_codon:yes stop_codon:yes gene_type:complete
MEINSKIFMLIMFFGGIIVLLTYTYFLLKNEIKSKDWPPTISKCPDYWIHSNGVDGESNLCNNVKNLGLSSCDNNIDMNTFIYDSKLLADDDCTKAKWARSCNLTWDGITNKENICD